MLVLSDLAPELIILIVQFAVAALPIRSTPFITDTLASVLSSYALVNRPFREAAQRELLRTVYPLNNVAIVRLIKVLKKNGWSDRIESIRIVPSYRTGRLVEDLLEITKRCRQVELDWEAFQSRPMLLSVLESSHHLTSLTLHLVHLPTHDRDRLRLPFLAHLVLNTCRLSSYSSSWSFPVLTSLILYNCHFDSSALFPTPSLRHLLIANANFPHFPTRSSMPTKLVSLSFRNSYLCNWADVTSLLGLIDPGTLQSLEMDVSLFRSALANEPRASSMVYDMLSRCESLQRLTIASAFLSANGGRLPNSIRSLKVINPRATDRKPHYFKESTLDAVMNCEAMQEVDVQSRVLWEEDNEEPLSRLESLCLQRKIRLRFGEEIDYDLVDFDRAFVT